MNHIMRRKFNEATNRLLGAEKVLSTYAEGIKAISVQLTVCIGGGDRVTLDWTPDREMIEQICLVQSVDARTVLMELLR